MLNTATFVFCLLLMGCGNVQDNNAQKVIDAYPAFNIKYADNKLLFPDGTAIVYDDGKTKSFTQQLDNSDIEDMFSMTYEVGDSVPAYLNDCGRSRNEALFKKMYGDSKAAVRKNLVKVNWFGRMIPFTRVNGASVQLRKVAYELARLPHLRHYLTNASSFNWRKVRGANRQSAHSYGIAIDINTVFSDYWLWKNPNCTETDTLIYQNRIPKEIVNVFEKYGFIWGGRWYHYDTMHFEYRPELLRK
ncbi:MAG: M15 family metallopeptidase [Prevotella sp.]|nr:M15 family metallopeptidase [Prevotella sp.]